MLDQHQIDGWVQEPALRPFQRHHRMGTLIVADTIGEAEGYARQHDFDPSTTSVAGKESALTGTQFETVIVTPDTTHDPEHLAHLTTRCGWGGRVINMATGTVTNINQI